MLGSVSAFYEPDAVIMAAGITAGVTIGLTLFAFQTKWDFTTCGGKFLIRHRYLYVDDLISLFITITFITK